MLLRQIILNSQNCDSDLGNTYSGNSLLKYFMYLILYTSFMKQCTVLSNKIITNNSFMLSVKISLPINPTIVNLSSTSYTFLVLLQLS